MRLRYWALLLALLMAAPVAAQNPVTIAKVGSVPVTTSVPVSQSGNFLVQGLVANDAVYSGNPLPLGCYASASAPSNVSADGDMVRMWCLRNGALSVTFTNTTIAVTNTGTFAVQAAQSGDWNSRTQDGSGNAITSTASALDINIKSGNPTSISATQGTTPWIVAGGGTAGTPGTAVLTVQGVASGTNLNVAQATASSLNATVVQGTATNLKAQAEAYQGGTAVGSGNPLQVTLANTGSNTNKLLVTPDANSTVDLNKIAGQTPSTSANGVLYVSVTPGATGGWSTLNATSGDGSTALTNSAQTIKGSAGVLGGWYIYNPNPTVAYVPIYNNSSPTVGTTNPQMLITIPPGAAITQEMANGLNFATAITAAATSTAGGNGALTTALDANFWFK